MTDMRMPMPPDAGWLDELQAAFYPWFGRPEWWPPHSELDPYVRHREVHETGMDGPCG